MARKIMVVGAGSRLGRVVVPLLNLVDDVEVRAFGRDELDILDEAGLRQAIEQERPATVINCAGFNDIVAAEHERAECLPVNTRGACNLARAATDFRFYLCLFSSKQVFNGKKGEPYDEEDELWPENQYGLSKQGAEEMVANLTENYLILRSDYLFGFPGDGIDELVARLQKGEDPILAEDYFIAPTYVGDLGAAMVMLALEWAAGIYHYTSDAGNSGISCFDFARAVAEAHGFEAGRLKPLPRHEIDYGYPVNLPERAILSIERFRKIFPALVRPWEEALNEYLAQKGK